MLPGSGPAHPALQIETHISWVLICGGHAYKFKKAVDLGFADFSTLSQRRHCCAEELRLNRRLAPDLYLDVITITGPAEAPSVDGPGPVLEYAVRMREFPQQALASHALERGELASRHVDRLATDVAAFHAGVAVAGPDSPYGRPEDALRAALTNFEVIRSSTTDPTELDELVELEAWTQGKYARRRELLAQRLATGFVRECHGDLHLGNIVLHEGRLVVFDCIEFNPRLRWIDVMSEIAFVVMDLVDRGSPALAHRFLNAYLELTGDYAGLPLLSFFLVYRAMVRAKVARLRLGQLEPGEPRQPLQDEYGSYLELARRFSRPPRPALIVTHGLSGCGKTRWTSRLVEATGAVRIRSDVERKRLRALPAAARSGSGIADGLYAADHTRETYRAVAELAHHVLDAGEIAIVDATCLKRWQRDLFRALATAEGVPFVLLTFTASEATLRRRVDGRARKGVDASEADAAVLEHQLATQEPLAADELAAAIVWNTDDLPPADSSAANDASAVWEAIRQRIGLATGGSPAAVAAG